LRLPPYRPEFNPIEKIWAIVKNWVAARNTTFKMADVEDLARQKFDSVTSETRSSVCEHVDKLVMSIW
jgi:transposase